MTPVKRLTTASLLVVLLLLLSTAPAAELTDRGNRLTYPDSDNPFYPHKDFPKLITPQWVGEPGVEAVVILSIDDMRDSAKYEAFLRPILERLKQIDGRAPVSIFANTLQPDDPQLQTWLKEGLSLEVHTLTHPCPLLQKGSFTNAWNTYHGGVDLLNQVPNNKPVASRMPCCDSMNSPSPRFYAEIFNRTSDAGNFLQIDSSVMCLLTDLRSSRREEALNEIRNDQSLVTSAATGVDRFRKYFPAQTNEVTKRSLANFATYIEDYPYPYVINKVCWEFPAMVPSDWEAFNLHGPTNAVTLADWKAALDIVVGKQGVFTWIFHPHGWCSSEQIVEFIDYTVATHGKKVKFLTFKEALERLNGNLLAGKPLRNLNGSASDVAVIDQDGDGRMDVVAAQENTLPIPERDKLAALLGSLPDLRWLAGELAAPHAGKRRSWLVRDMDHDGICELIVANPEEQAVFAWNETGKQWAKLPDGTWPAGVAIVNERGEDNGVRFVDVNGDGFEDILYSNEHEYALWLYIHTPKKNLGWERGWTFQARAGKREANPDSALPVPRSTIPPIVRAGPHRNNGVWFRAGAMWIQNEDTAHLPDVVQRITFSELLTGGEVPPRSPEESLKAFDVRPDFQIELVAAEPLVFDPVAYEWGADGRLWVVEMADYPSGLPTPDPSQEGNPEARAAASLPSTGGAGSGFKPGGRVICLTDTDDDGRYDTRTVFLDGLNFPSGVMPWRKGVLISAAPEILYAEDTDGDGKADLKKVLFTGFIEGNQQHRVNGFEYGLDGWIYAANGDSGGKIHWSGETTLPGNGERAKRRDGAPAGSPARPISDSPLDIRGQDFRFNPDTGEIETVAGQTQFGRRRDDWGNWFGNNNPTWLWHYHIPIHYLKRNPHLAVKSVRTVLANYDNANRVFAVSTPQTRFNWADRTFQTTSACSPCPYRDDLFGPDFATSVFISEPANNVIHREVLEPDGVTFRSRRAADEQDREFLASRDNWFRPTMLKTGPDGALYIADMYRLILEHPQYFPDELKNRPDLRAGDDKGRLWRVFPKGAKLRKVPRLDKLNTTDLVAALDSPSGCQRDTVQRLLVERHGRSQGDSKERSEVFRQLISISSTHASPKVRIQALGAIVSLGLADVPTDAHFANGPSAFWRATADKHPAVQAFAIEHGSNKDPMPDLSAASARGRFMAAFRIGRTEDASGGRYLAQLALRDFDDPNLRLAILSSAPRHLSPMIEAALNTARTGEQDSRRVADLLQELFALAVAMKDNEVIQLGLKQLTDKANDSYAPWQMSGLLGFADSAERRGTAVAQLASQAGVGVAPMFAQARRTASDNNADIAARETAIRLLGRGPNEQEADLKTLGLLLGPQHPPEVQRAALDSLKGLRLPAVGETLLAGWKSYGPAMRKEVLALVLTRSEWTVALLSAIDDGVVMPGEIPAETRQALSTHGSSAIRIRTARIFGAVNTDRAAVLKQYSVVKDLKADARRGASLFGGTCTTCHPFRGQGNAFGPDLGTMTGKTVDSLLTAILDPSAAVDAAYTGYTVITKDDRELVGIIVAETPNSLTIRNSGGGEDTILRSQIAEFRANALSLMPEGLEAQYKPQDLADLIAFLLESSKP